MGYEKGSEPQTDAKFLVNASNAMGSVVAREGFPTKAEADALAEKLRADGHTVEVSPMKPEGQE